MYLRHNSNCVNTRLSRSEVTQNMPELFGWTT